MTDKPLVSVILPVYNGERLVGESLKSALCQTYSNIEILVINDGSTDQTAVVVKNHAAGDPRVRILEQDNAGVARARNRGIAESTGEFIATLDADDIWEPTKIERQVARMAEAGEETGLVYTWWLWIDTEGCVLARSPHWLMEGKTFEQLLQVNYTGNASVPLYRRKCIDSVGGYNEQLAASDAGGCEDWDIALRVAERFDVAVVPEVLVGYRRRPGSMSTGSKTMWRSREQVFHSFRERRGDVPSGVFRRSSSQFALHLAAVSFWDGDYLRAFLWGLRAAASPLPFLIFPHAVSYLTYTLWQKYFHKPASTRIVPGESFKAAHVPGPSIPYDLLYQKLVWRRKKPH